MRGWLGVCAVVGMTLVGCGSSTEATTTTQGSGASGGEASAGSSVTFRNRSNYAIYHIQMSPVSQRTWGEDHLGTHVLQAGQDFTLSGVPCNSYDLRLVDEDGDECILNNINICGEDAGWTIDNNDLLTCQAWTSSTGSAN